MLIFFFPTISIHHFLFYVACHVQARDYKWERHEEKDNRVTKRGSYSKIEGGHACGPDLLPLNFFFLVAPWVGDCPNPKSCWAYPGIGPDYTNVGAEKRGSRESCRLRLCFVASIIRESLWNLIQFGFLIKIIQYWFWVISCLFTHLFH